MGGGFVLLQRGNGCPHAFAQGRRQNPFRTGCVWRKGLREPRRQVWKENQYEGCRVLHKPGRVRMRVNALTLAVMIQFVHLSHRTLSPSWSKSHGSCVSTDHLSVAF